MRLKGASYEDIAGAGGGIRSTVAATRAASDDALLSSARKRALTLMAEGVTTLEIKSGYGLTQQDEARCLAVARQLGTELPLTVRTTYLGAHAVPPEFQGRADDYIDAVCSWMPSLHARGLIDAVDAFCENIGFSLAQTRCVFDAAKALGLPVKLHAEQLSDQGGAALAAEYARCPVTIWNTSDSGACHAGRRHGAALLPGAYYFCAKPGCPHHRVALAACPSHWRRSQPARHRACHCADDQHTCTLFRITPEEAVRGVTVNGARALG